MTNRTKAHLSILTANLIYGANYSIARLAMPEYISPTGFIVLRVIFACLLFFLLDRPQSSRAKIDRSDYLRFFLLGFFGVALNQILFFEGLSRTTNINAALIMTTTPVLVPAMAFFLIKDFLNSRQVGGIFLGLSGAVLLILQYRDIQGTATSTGDLMVFINAASYALFLVMVKPLMRKYSTIQVMKWTFLTGSIFVLPYGLPQLQGVQWSAFPAEAWLSIAFVLLFTTFTAYLLNTFGLKHLSPSVVSYYIYLQPVFATLIALSIANERITSIQVIACLLIFLGVYLVNRRTFVKPES